MSLRWLMTACLVAGLPSCATLEGAPKAIKSNLTTSTVHTGFTLRSPLEYTSKQGWAGVEWTETLRTGTYVAFLENEEGILFKGPHRCVTRVQGHAKHEGSVPGSDGGIWIPKPGSNEKPRLWFVFSTDKWERLSVGLVGAAIYAAEEGNLVFLKPIEDPNIVSSIQPTSLSEEAVESAPEQ